MRVQSKAERRWTVAQSVADAQCQDDACARRACDVQISACEPRTRLDATEPNESPDLVDDSEVDDGDPTPNAEDVGQDPEPVDDETGRRASE